MAYLNRDGYLVVSLRENGKRMTRLVHRLAMEKHIGRKLHYNEVVHHRNGVKTDNSIENLEVMDRTEHSLHHAPESKTAQMGKNFWAGNNETHKKCKTCGRIKLRALFPTKGSKNGNYPERSECYTCFYR